MYVCVCVCVSKTTVTVCVCMSVMLLSHWRRGRGDVAPTPATVQSQRLRRLVKPQIASTHTRATFPRRHRYRCV